MELLKSVDEFINGDYNVSYFAIYPFTNENINGYLPYFDLNGKSLMTVGSSGDQAINAKLAGCDDITVHDICPLSKSFYFLKLAAMLCLNREDFINFLVYDDIFVNESYLNKETFNKIKSTLKTLDYESYYIWEHIFEHYSSFDIERLFRIDTSNIKEIINYNLYLKDDYHYNLARKQLMNLAIRFMEGNIISPELNRKFYNIWLSNVAHSIPKEQRKQMIENNKKLLEDGGRMLNCYFWNRGMTLKGFKVEGLNESESKPIIIPGIEDLGDNSILMYEKKKTLR